MKRIHLSQTDKKIGGVLGGMGETYDVDPTLLRIIAILVAFATAVVPTVIAYLVAWAIIPEKPETPIQA